MFKSGGKLPDLTFFLGVNSIKNEIADKGRDLTTVGFRIVFKSLPVIGINPYGEVTVPIKHFSHGCGLIWSG